MTTPLQPPRRSSLLISRQVSTLVLIPLLISILVCVHCAPLERGSACGRCAGSLVVESRVCDDDDVDRRSSN